MACEAPCSLGWVIRRLYLFKTGACPSAAAEVRRFSRRAELKSGRNSKRGDLARTLPRNVECFLEAVVFISLEESMALRTFFFFFFRSRPNFCISAREAP